MADKVKKGFAFYLIMFILLIVAAFVVIVTVMLFSPGKSILGFKYFANGADDGKVLDVIETKVIESGTEKTTFSTFKFDNVSQININTNVAAVNVYKSENVFLDTVQIVANSSGFAKAAQNTNFTIKNFEMIDDPADTSTNSANRKKIINIDIVEPEGFLYFSKNFSVNIIVPEKRGEIDSATGELKEDKDGKTILKENNYRLENTKINIETKKGKVNIGDSVKKKVEGKNEKGETVMVDPVVSVLNSVAPKMINIKTDSGRINFNKYSEIQLTNSNLVTNTGSITSVVNAYFNNNNSITTQSGKIYFPEVLGRVVYGDNASDYQGYKSAILSLNIGNGKFESEDVRIGVNLTVENGQFKVNKKMYGLLSTGNSRDKINKAEINVASLSGQLSIPYGGNSKINVGEVDRDVNIAIKNGSVNIGDIRANRKVRIASEKGNISVAPSATSDVRIETVSGNVKVTFEKGMTSCNTEIVSKSGNVSFAVLSSTGFVLEIKDANGEYVKTLNKNISLDFVDVKEYDSPMKINDYTGSDNLLSIQTGGKINGGIINITSLN